jgi:uncharacterized protein DUF3616
MSQHVTLMSEESSMVRRIGYIALLAVFAASDARAMEYIGICEASAGAFIDGTHFAVASDETNTLQIYERGKPAPIRNGVDMAGFTTFNKSDLEGAAAIGDRVYWISSHSFNSKGKDNDKRKVFFATRIVLAQGKPPTLIGVGQPAKSLRDPLAKVAGVAPGELNIEALAATPEGGLLIGLRAPLRDGRALVIPFKNPAQVVDQGAQPEFGAPVPIDLKGNGLRSMDLLPGQPEQYIIVAGPVADSADGFALFRWSGPKTNSDPVKIEGLNLTGIKPEGAMVVPGQNVVQLLSDDGDICSDEDDPPNKRKFRSIDVTP